MADTSVLLNLCRIGHEHLLPALFREVQIPLAVRAEFERLAQSRPRFRGLAVPQWIQTSRVLAIPPQVAACPALDQGETEALALAIQINADAVLIDEAAARSAALQLQISFIGIGGILLRAKNLGLIETVRPLLDRLRSEASFWLAPAFEAYLMRLAGEAP